MMDALDIVVVSFNTRARTDLCLNHLMRYTDLPYHLWVVDNGSSDGSQAMLQHWVGRFNQRMTLLQNPINLGYAEAVQQVYPHLGTAQVEPNPRNPPEQWVATQRHLAYVNSDVYVGPQWASKLCRHLYRHPRVAAVAPIGRGIGGKQDAIFHFAADDVVKWESAGPEQAVIQVHAALARANPVAETAKMLQGTLWVIRSDAHLALGGLDAGCVCGADDADWSLRARLAGWQLLIALDTYVWHDNHSSFCTLTDLGQTLVEHSWDYFNHKWAGQFDSLSWDDLMVNTRTTEFPPYVYQSYTERLDRELVQH